MIPSGAEPRQFAALPFTYDEGAQLYVLLITSRRTGRWVLPKGWSEGEESGPQTAAREAAEEAGVVGQITPTDALGSYPYRKAMRDGGSLACRVIVFGLKVEGFQPNFREKGKRALRWCSPAYGAELVHEPELASLLRRLSSAGAAALANPS
jgi:8-oxo-dGTP pyrophosphatase MutT (NUDIX family)